MKISASIVTYNNQEDIENILNCLMSCQHIGLSDIYVVDNDSKDRTVDIVANNYPTVKLIKSNKNLGYGSGHNMAIRLIESDYHLIVNPDITLEANQLEKMIEYMHLNHNVSLLGPRVLYPDGTEQFLPKKMPQFKYLLGGLIPLFNKYRKEYTMSCYDINEPIEIDFCSGCFMICRTTCLKQCKGFDERFFLYFEDADLTLTMKRYGKTIYNPNFTVIHSWKRDNHRTLRGIRRFISSYRKFKKKWKML